MNSNNTENRDNSAHLNLLLMHQAQRRTDCEILSSEEPQNLQGVCPTVWDGILCWTNVSAGSMFTQPCPDYVPGLHPNGTASKFCATDGDWFFDPVKNTAWTDYTKCLISQIHDHPYQSQTNQSIIQEWLPIIKTVSQVGYGLSLATLIIAFFILVSIKAFMALLKDVLFHRGVGLSISVLEGDEGLVFRHDQPNWECKLVTSLWQYFIVANYLWILMEGLYLHNRIFISPFSSSSSLVFYVLLGWGCPLVVVGSWILVRLQLEDTLCWTTNYNRNIFLIIRIPIIVSIVLNFIFFLNIVRVLFLKLQSSVSVDTRNYRYRKWAKSTLILMPLFGVHYMLFLWMSSFEDQNPVIEVIWLFCDQLFASFQGFLVAILYCLNNGEVRLELSKKWDTIKTSKEVKNIMIPLNRLSTRIFHKRSSKEIQSAQHVSKPGEQSNLNNCSRIPTVQITNQDQYHFAGIGIDFPETHDEHPSPHSTYIYQNTQTEVSIVNMGSRTRSMSSLMSLARPPCPNISDAEFQNDIKNEMNNTKL